ncbi:MAG TPA: YdcF family protein [Trebonia sp.]|nr:YdcF family protein [Trebonia sp.]
MFTLGLAVLAFVAFLASMVADARSFRNAVFLGLALALAALGLADRLVDLPGSQGHLLLLALLLVVALGPFGVACYLVGNGVMMAGRERLRPVNLLPLVAAAAIFVVIGLHLAADRTGSVKLSLLATVTTLVFGYVSFLLVSFVIYSWVYGQVAGLVSRADYVIVLGAGLGRHGQVTPLLASRLERGREVWEALAGRGASPVLIVSGGQGSDERVPEAAAMAAYLLGHGFPGSSLVREQRSRTTEENLAFSKVIMDAARPASPGGRDARCVIVTSNYHVFRTAIIARKAGIRGQVTGARTAGYYWPTAMLREFAAVFLRYRVVNIGICCLLALAPIAHALAGRI